MRIVLPVVVIAVASLTTVSSLMLTMMAAPEGQSVTNERLNSATEAYDAGEYASAFAVFQAAALQGNANAQYNLGRDVCRW